MLALRQRHRLSAAALFAIESLEQRCLLSSPYSPGQTIEAEDFVNTSGDVEIDPVPGASGGAAVVGMLNNHWLEYAITVPQAGAYGLSIRAATAEGADGFDVTVDGHQLTQRPPQQVDQEQPWANFNEGGIQLSSGGHVVRATARVPTNGTPEILDSLRFESGPMNLDPSFGNGGVVQLPDYGFDVVGVRTDGKYVTTDPQDPAGNLVLHNTDNTIFGPLRPGDGIPIVWFNNTITLPDGRLLLTVSSQSAGASLDRVNLDGMLDPSFGQGGQLDTGLDSIAYAVQPQDGKIVVAGVEQDTMVVKRYWATGASDPSFGTDGTVRMDLSRAVPQPRDNPWTVMTQLEGPLGAGVRPDGKIVIGLSAQANDRAHPWPPENDYFIFVQLQSDGAVDAAFGEGGIAPRVYSYEGAWTVKMDLLPNGYIAAMWGSLYDDNEIDFFDPIGSAAGWAWIGQIPGTFDVGPDGKPVGVGGDSIPTIGRAAETPLGPNRYGNDPSFDPVVPSVLLPQPIPPYPQSKLSEVGVQDDGKIVALGTIFRGSGYLFRFEGDAHGSYPFYGTPADPTQPIQVEDFDRGAEGAAYHDADPLNKAGAYRASGVDVGYTDDNGPAIGVGYTEPGEWLNYTVNVPSDGVYAMNVRVASDGQGGTFHFELDGQNTTGQMQIPDTGSWSNWTTIRSPLIQISAGKHVLRLVMDIAGPNGAIGNFNYFQLTAAPAYPPDQTIEAENFSASSGGVQVASVNGASGGRAILNMQEGEWAEYAIHIPQAGHCSIVLRISATNLGAFNVSLDSADFAQSRSFGSIDWIETSIGNGDISAGDHILRITLARTQDPPSVTFDALRIVPTPLNLDTSFGNNGVVELPSYKNVVGVQQNGEYLTLEGTDADSYLVLRATDASIDPTLGQGQPIPTVMFGSAELLPDGSYMVMQRGGILMRFRPDGTLDPTFAAGGILNTNLDWSAEFTVQPANGRILIAGTSDESTLVVRRLLPNGSPDKSFGTETEAQIDLSRSTPQPSQGSVDAKIYKILGINVRPDGRIFIGTYLTADDLPSFDPESDYFGFIQLEPDGTIDHTFNGGGVEVQKFGFGGDEGLKTTLLPDGRIAAMWTGFYGDNWIKTYDPAGTLLETYRIAGDIGQDFAVGPDGTPVATSSPTGFGSEGNINILHWPAWIPGDQGISAGWDEYQGRVPALGGADRIAVQDDGKIIAFGRLADFSIGFVRLNGDAHGSYPFHGTPADPTQPVQVEDFDRGAEGTAYHDSDPANQAGAYRTTGVDVGYTDDNGPAIGIGYTAPGEWLNYTVNIPQSGQYQLKVRVASQGIGGTFHFELDSANITGELSIPNTASWSNWTTISSPPLQLPSGPHILRLVMDNAGPTSAIGNFNYFQLIPQPPAQPHLSTTLTTASTSRAPKPRATSFPIFSAHPIPPMLPPLGPIPIRRSPWLDPPISILQTPLRPGHK